MQFPTIYINLGYFLDLGSLPFPLMLARLFLDGGWIVVVFVVLYGGWLLWVQERQIKFAKTVTTTLLAIDVPRLNEQTPKAVEQIFNHLSGAYSGLDNYEKYWLGKFQTTFSFEIVSIGGYVQFLVHCWSKFRDLVESAVYSQYPDAEIIEVDDYADKVPTLYPDPEWDAWGTEYVLKKPSVFPLRTHIQFEHSLSEEYFKDPISSILEVMSAIKPGEQLWFQILISPTDDSWKDASQKVVDKMMGRVVAPKKGIVDHLVDIPIMAAAEMAKTPLVLFGGEAEAPAKPKDAMPKMMALTPGERSVLEAIQLKAAKIGFNCKMRMVYVGKRSVFSKGRVVSSFKGALGQFTALDSNALKGYGPVTPKTDYAWERLSAARKQSAVVRNYRNRSGRGAPPYILNSEELATIYHFPYVHVKAPSVKKTEAKRGEPPVHLPTLETAAEGPFKKKKAAPPKPPAPEPEADETEEEEES